MKNLGNHRKKLECIAPLKVWTGTVSQDEGEAKQLIMTRLFWFSGTRIEWFANRTARGATTFA